MGSHTVELLLERGFQVRCLIRRTRQGNGWIQGLSVEIVRGSYYDVDSLRDAVKGVDYIFHIAGVTKAKKHRQFHDGNVLATRNLLEAATGVKNLRKFCYVSSLTAAGPSLDGVPRDENAPGSPVTTYGVTKLEAETVCELYANRVPIVVLRPPAVFGPRDRDILEIFRWVKRGIIPAFGTSKKRLSLIYGPELARGIVEATLAEQTRGETYFISDPVPYQFREIAQKAARLLGRRGVTITLPSFLLYSLAGISEFINTFNPDPPILSVEKVRDLVQPDWSCTPAKLERAIGFRTQVPIEEALAKTLAWYQEQGWL